MERITPDDVQRLHRDHPDLTQRELAARAGVSQATISRLLHEARESNDQDEDLDEDLEVDEDHVDRDDDPDVAHLGDSPLEDLARRVVELDRTARRAEHRRQYGAATTARRAAAKLREQLDQLREQAALAAPRARTDEPDEVLVAELAALIPDLPDAAFEALEDAVAARRRKAAEPPGGRDGG